MIEQTKPTFYTAVVGLYDEAWANTLAFRADGQGREAVLKAREIKIKYSRRFPVSMWHDANIIPRDSERLFSLFDRGDFVVMSHPSHNCVYKEANHVINLKKDSRPIVLKQVERYEREGFPKDFACYATGVMMRRNCKPVRDVMKLWWEEVKNGSVRDQISLPYVCWKLGISPVVVSWDMVFKIVTKKSHAFKHNFAR